MYVNEQGLGVQPIRPIALNRENIDRFRDLMIVRLHSMNVSVRSIGRILGIHHTTVVNRLENEIPPAVYEHYRKRSIGDVISALKEG